MDCVFYLTVSWFTIVYFIVNIKKKETIKNLIIYMTLIFLISISTGIISTNLELITTNHEMIKFIEVLLHRLIITPFLMLILVSKYDGFKGILQKSMSVIFTLTLLILLEYINIKLQLYRYVKWSAFHSIILYSSFIFTTLILNTFYNVMEKRSE